jgi:hypothetical protein
VTLLVVGLARASGPRGRTASWIARGRRSNQRSGNDSQCSTAHLTRIVRMPPTWPRQSTRAPTPPRRARRAQPRVSLRRTSLRSEPALPSTPTVRICARRPRVSSHAGRMSTASWCNASCRLACALVGHVRRNARATLIITFTVRSAVKPAGRANRPAPVCSMLRRSRNSRRWRVVKGRMFQENALGSASSGGAVGRPTDVA